MKRSLIISLSLFLCLVCSAETIDVKSFRYAGPYAVQKPFLVDTTNVKGTSYKPESILDAAMPLEAVAKAAFVQSVPAAEGANLHLLGFSLQNESFVKATLRVEGTKNYKLYLDGKKHEGKELKLEPATHELVLTVYAEGALDSLKVSVESKADGLLTLREDGRKRFNLDLNTEGPSCGGVSVSPSGKIAAVVHRNTDSAGRSSSYTELVNTADGKTLYTLTGSVRWMPNTDEYYITRANVKSQDLIAVDPLTGKERFIARNIPQGRFEISPALNCLIYTMSQEGPKEGAVHQILVPDDRQPGWRNRSYLSKYDIATGVMQPLTFGFHNSYLSDISDDGRYILFQTDRDRLTQRPTTLFSLYRMDLQTLQTDCLIEDDGFITGAQFSPDGKEVLVTGSGEAFGGFAAEVKEGQIPSNYQYLLFVLNVADKSVKTLTKGFAPSPQSCNWSRYDGRIYFYAEDKDCKNLFRVDPKTAKIERLNNLEEYMYNFSIAKTGPALVYYGQGLNNADRAYYMDVLKGKQKLLFDFDAQRLENVDKGQGFGYDFTSSRGDVINGYYVLPPDFDPNKKYPMVVFYYGGCSPTTRYFIGSYSPQYYAAQGYVFYVVNPSGASGFGQEFAARHVNTAGDVVVDDIIEGVMKFCEDHPYVDSKHVGCFSASYGGFMTQLILTKTDFFRTGISHAGISSHTSYWGEGYWGYSYSETSMANSYPWTRKDLYVDRSTLYNADKIHTPLLFLHGSADTNVPIGESIQMFTALKLLGQDTAFVVVDGENHGISEFGKKRDWLRTISAWYAKYLKEDSSWWDEMYPPKSL